MEFVQERISFDVLRSHMRKGHAMDPTLLHELALLVLHHIDEALRLKFLDQQLDEIGFARSASAIDISSAIFDDRVGRFVLKRVLRSPADFFGLVQELARALALKWTVRGPISKGRSIVVLDLDRIRVSRAPRTGTWTACLLYTSPSPRD